MSQETGPSERDLVATYTKGAIINAGLQPETAQRLVAQAEAGLEASWTLIEGAFCGSYAAAQSDRRQLERYYAARGSTTWEILKRDGQRFSGTPASELRDASGRIVNPKFIDTLTTRGVAVETDRRPWRGTSIPVNHIWSLEQGLDGEYLPLAKVRTIDADGFDAARLGGLHARPVVMRDEVVVFPGLQLPTPQEVNSQPA